MALTLISIFVFPQFGSSPACLIMLILAVLSGQMQNWLMAEPEIAKARLAEVNVEGLIPIERLTFLRHQLGILMSEHTLKVVREPESSDADPWEYFLEKGYLSRQEYSETTDEITFVAYDNVRLYFKDNGGLDYQTFRNSWSNLHYHFTWFHKYADSKASGRYSRSPMYLPCECGLEESKLGNDTYEPLSIIKMGAFLGSNPLVQSTDVIKTKHLSSGLSKMITSYSEALLSQLP